MTHRAGVVSALAALVVTLAAASLVLRSDPTVELVLWPFEDGRISADGTQVQVRPYAPSDLNCQRFSHIDTEVVEGQLVVSVFFELHDAQPGGTFCMVPCPLFTLEPVTAEIPPVATDDLEVVRHPDTPPHCSETMG